MRQPAYCVVGGHSHIAAFGVPISISSRAAALYELPHRSGRFRIMAGEWPRTEAYWREVAKAAAGNVVAVFWRGNQHLSRHLLEPSHHFDVVLSSEPDLPLDETATIVPEALVRASFMPTLQGLAQVLRFLQAAGATPVVCGTPPPSGDDTWIVNNYLVSDREWLRSREAHHEVPPLEQEGPWLEELQVDVAIDPRALKLTSRVLRYKMWAVLQALECETAAAGGAAFLASPTAARTAEGFLRDQYRRDISHGNDAYGALVLEGLWQWMQADNRPMGVPNVHPCTASGA